MKATCEERLQKLLKVIGSKSKCKGCYADIYWVKTPGGKNMPVDIDGTPHWASCPQAEDFKKRQREMF